MINLEEIQKIYNELRTPVQEQLIKYNIKNSADLWRQKYSEIKDESWPECNTMENFYNLPKHIQDECHNVHQFSPTIWKQKIQDDATFEFQLPPSSNQRKIIEDNLKHIVNKDIVDFACNIGGYSFAAIDAGANSVIGFDIRDENLRLADAVKEFAYSNNDKLKFVKLDIHNYSGITEVCSNKQTVLIPGVMYHVHDHYQILLAVAKANVDTIIIETGEADAVLNSNEPLIWWKTENTFEHIAGWLDGSDTIPVGYPNEAWFKLIMGELQYECVTTSQYHISVSKHDSDEFIQVRTVYVFQRSI